MPLALALSIAVMSRKKLTRLPPALAQFAEPAELRVLRHVCPRGRHHVLYIIGDGRWRLLCTHGCRERDILAAFGLPPDALKPNPRATEKPLRYSYLGLDGEPLFDVFRRPAVARGQGRFYVRNRGGGLRRGYLYRLPELLAAPRDEPVFWVEGERDVESLRAHGLVAVTTSFGAYSYDPAMAQYLAGRTVIILPDNDEPGEMYAKAVARSLDGIAKSVQIIRLTVPPKQDVSYFLEQGGRVTDLLRMAGLPEFLQPVRTPPPRDDTGGRLGSLEARILLALSRAEHHHLTIDALPAVVAGLPGIDTWNARAKQMLMRYPDVAPEVLRRTRAGLSRAVRTLAEKGWITRTGRSIRPARRGWIDAARAAQSGMRARLS
jgi:hypothetical protein